MTLDNSLTFDEMMALRGECFRHQKGRRTLRLRLENKSCFIKQHWGIGYREIIKNLLQFRLPVISALQEWRAIKKLETLGVAVPTVLACDERGLNPASRQSFILMEEIAPAVSLEELGKTFQSEPPLFAFKRQLILKVAEIAKILHENGMNHRDFYLCHFLWKQSEEKLYLIDLHRAQIQRLTARRSIIKDLSGLYFSAMDCGLTQRDYYRFIKRYTGKPLRDILIRDKIFWDKVRARGERLYSDHS